MNVYKPFNKEDQSRSIDQEDIDCYRRYQRRTSSWGSGSLIDQRSTASSFELLFSRLLDAFIFTSAIAITAYSYLTGTLLEKSSPNHTISSRQPSHQGHISYQQNRSNQDDRLYKDNRLYSDHSSYQDHLLQDHRSYQDRPLSPSSSKYLDNHHKRRSTLEWAEQQLLLPSEPSTPIIKKRSRSTSNHHSLKSSSQESQSKKKRAKSLPVNKIEDEALSRMEERLQSLIQQGQEALSSPIH